MNVGILGLGSIGLRHASNSIKLRHNVFGYDVDYNKSNDLKKIGGEFISQKNRCNLHQILLKSPHLLSIILIEY